jgi:hypothetical protein
LCLVSLMTDPTARWNSSHCSPAGDAVEAVGFDGGAFGEAVEPMDPARGMVLHEGDGAITAFRPRAGAFGASSILSRQSGLCQADLESGVECYRVANWGRSPKPPRRACRPPASPLRKTLCWCTFKPTGAAQFLGGADTLQAQTPFKRKTWDFDTV